MTNRNRPGMPEIVVRDLLLGMQTVDADVDVEICLDIVTHLACTLELFSSSTHAIGEGLVTLRDPTSLHPRPLLLVPLVLPILAEKSSNRFDRLLRVDLLKAPGGLSSLHELGDSPRPQRLPLARDAPLVLRGIVGELLHGRMLREGGLEIRPIHQDIPGSF